MAPNKPVIITLMPSVGEETEREGKHRFNQTSVSNCYITLLKQESEGQQQKAGFEDF
jgi:hypothetical protein